MNYLLVLPALLLAQTSPTITVDKARITYGSTLQVTIINPTSTPITYYINLDVLVAGYWGAADEDILNPTHEKLVRYTMQSLKPGQKISIRYNTKVLLPDYAQNFHTYRLSLHCVSNRDPARERVIYSAEFAISLSQVESQTKH